MTQKFIFYKTDYQSYSYSKRYILLSVFFLQVANVPVASFDRMMVDSDLDTVKSLLVHQKFHNAALGKSVRVTGDLPLEPKP